MPGLSSQEAQARLAKYGENRLPEPKETSALVIFIRQFKSPFIYVLFAAAVVSWFLGQQVNSYFILAVLLLNAVIGTVQEYSAARAAKALKKMVPSFASVYRDGDVIRIETHLLVPGDLVQLVSGDKVPADIQLKESRNLSADESLLTGESLPQSKSADAQVSSEAPLSERSDSLFAGTLISQGRGKGEVVATGFNTQLGKIVKQVAGGTQVKPPLMQRIESFTRKISVAILLIIALLFVITVLRGDDLSEVFLMGVALAVSAIPEGLPAAITVALAIGMGRMAKKGVIVRKLLAVEALGSCTFIASDKTGTLTMNEMTITEVDLSDGHRYRVTGEGLDLHGEVENESARTNGDLLHELALCAALANEATLRCEDGQWFGEGDKVDQAFLVLAAKLGYEPGELTKVYPQQGLIPYESEHAYCASINIIGQQHKVCIKGSVERLLPMCSLDGLGRELDKEQIHQQTSHMASRGLRVLAVAGKALELESIELTDALHHMRFLGLVGIKDPIRPGVIEAIAECKTAHLEIAMVTGDHPDTALAVARELQFEPYPQHAVIGQQIKEKEADSVGFDALVDKGRVYARVEPQQKLQLVQAWQRQGHFVAVTGDGVNDAPALRHAHVGVAMGQRGTDVARESADLIITDDNFASLVEGIRQGRIVYNNIRKVVFLLISTGAAEIVLFILSVLMGLPLPLLPVQLLWLNLVTNGLQDVALAFEPAEGDELRRAPRKPKEPVFDRLMIERVLINALAMGCIAFAIFYLALEQGMSVESARNTTLLLMVLFENIHVFNSRSETRSIFKHRFFSNPFLLFGMLAAQGLHIGAMHSTFLGGILQIEPVALTLWAQLLGLACTLLLVDEIHKVVIHRRQKAHAV
ncbi:HAD-IC family P-type ATPase [Aliiglaciecola sp. CAU 1673]|uniref:cation-translocating P-type ATPase n=1 Tax=Aliiglaciecola sp. CAU 1673 TaxID=3032595 RepID=UPI0023DC2AB4|nr:HAD-IC family P-type ATPase [Aliiglaciecola sp. CAU 1673]MDF2180183.1 HAD-IC family P-type ATPase [Aliiglaciecola sp. CAU 1673]